MADTIEDIFAKRVEEHFNVHRRNKRRRLLLLLAAAAGGPINQTPSGPDVTPPVFTSSATGTNPENTVLAFTITTNEPTTKVITAGADLARFEIVNGGTIAFSHTLRWLGNITKDFEAPDDSNTNNIYAVTVTATDAALNANPQTIMITVTDVDEVAPTITSANAANNVENTVLAHSLTANEAVTWTLTGGADLARFELSGSTLRWLGNGTKDFEAPDDVGTNNTYVVQVTATDAALNATNQTVTITVTDVVEDVTAPTVFAFSPLDDATGVSTNADFTIVFDENVQFHTTVAITLRLTSDDSIVETFDETDIGGTISIAGDTFTINPTSVLSGTTSYYVLIGATSIKDLTGNFFAGIALKTTWNFTTAAVDVTNPVVVTLDPADNDAAAAVTNQLIVTFDEAVQFHTTVAISLFLTNDTLVEAFTEADIGTKIVIVGTQLGINLTASLDPLTGYYVQIGTTSIKDMSGNFYAGIVDETTWNFTTAVAGIGTLLLSILADDPF